MRGIVSCSELQGRASSCIWVYPPPCHSSYRVSQIPACQGERPSCLCAALHSDRGGGRVRWGREHLWEVTDRELETTQQTMTSRE